MAISFEKNETPKKEEPIEEVKGISWEAFLRDHRKQMLPEEMQELGKGEKKFDRVYFSGTITERTPEDLAMIKDVNKERIETFNLKKN